MHALKMAVFDFDGTLVDSVPAIARGIQLANEEIGIAPVSYETAKSIIGLGFKDIIPWRRIFLKANTADTKTFTYATFFRAIHR